MAPDRISVSYFPLVVFVTIIVIVASLTGSSQTAVSGTTSSSTTSITPTPTLRPLLPELHVRADSYKDAGFQVGHFFADRIHSFWNEYSQTADVRAVLEFIKDDDNNNNNNNNKNGSAVFQALTDAIRQHMPNQWEELQGLAHGSGLPFKTILVINLLPELVDLVQAASAAAAVDAPVNQACTDLLLSGVGLAHNEDNEPSIGRYAYILNVSIGHHHHEHHYHSGNNLDTPQNRSLSASSWFTAYTYPGTLSGCAWAFNSHGLVQTTNALFPEAISMTNVGRYIVARSLLTASSIDQVEQQLSQVKEASAFSANFVELSTGRLANFEVGSGHPVDRYDVHNYYNHVNSFKRIHVKSRPSKSSEHRQARLDTLGKPRSLADMRSILGDTGDPAFPIYRNASGQDRSGTLCTLVIDGMQESIRLFLQNPATASFPQLQWNFSGGQLLLWQQESR